MMRKTLAAVAAAGALLAGIATASPALAASHSVTLLCSTATNDGTLVNGVCVLPAAAVGQPYEGFLLTGPGPVDTFTITSGSIPPDLQMPATYGAAGTIVGGTPTQQGTFTWTVHVVPITGSMSPTNGTYRITVNPAPQLTISFPTGSCCNAGTVGSSYLQNFALSGGVPPYTWTIAAGKLPPGVTQTGGSLQGTPTTAGTFTFTIKVTDSAGHQATKSGSITISP